MIKKLIITIALGLGVFCPVFAQQGFPIKDMELARRTYYKPLSKANFRFPSAQEALEVFQQGRALLDGMQTPKSAPDTIPQQNNIDTIQNFDDSLQVQYKYYQNIIQSSLDQEQSNKDYEHYQNFYEQIVWNKDGTPDLTKAATLKSYLAFYYLIHNNGKPSKLRVGRIDEHFPLLAINADSFAKLQEKFGNNDAYLWFTRELYAVSGLEKMFNMEDAERTEDIAKQILYTKFQNHGITPEQTEQWLNFATTWQSYAYLPDNGRGGAVTVYYEGNWYCTILLRPIVLKKGKQYFPLALVAAHEFQHIKDYFPGLRHASQYSLEELTTSISDVIMADEIHRQVYNIPDDEPVSYGHRDEAKGVNLWEIARFFRNLSQKYETDNYAELLLKPEATKYIEDTYNKVAENVIIAILKENNVPLDEISKEDKQRYGRESYHPILEEYFKNTERGGMFPN